MVHLPTRPRRISFQAQQRQQRAASAAADGDGEDEAEAQPPPDPIEDADGAGADAPAGRDGAAGDGAGRLPAWRPRCAHLAAGTPVSLDFAFSPPNSRCDFNSRTTSSAGRVSCSTLHCGYEHGHDLWLHSMRPCPLTA